MDFTSAIIEVFEKQADFVKLIAKE